jgi:hypothetical protein
MKALYVGHTIFTQTAPLHSGGWGVTVNVVRPDGTFGAGGAVTFATSDLAHQGGLAMGRIWVDRGTLRSNIHY